MPHSEAETAEVFKALGDATRLKILKEIACRRNHVCVMKIAEKVGISQPAVSQHLKTLKNAGIVEADRHGFYVHYRIKKECLDEYGIPAEQFLRNIGADVADPKRATNS